MAQITSPGTPFDNTRAVGRASHILEHQRRASDPWLATTRRRSAPLLAEAPAVGSVAYEPQHWRAQTVVGDQVVESRPAYRRIASLLWATHPRLEVLPPSSRGSSVGSKPRDDYCANASDEVAADEWQQAGAAGDCAPNGASPARAVGSTPQPPGRFPDDARQSAAGSLRRHSSFLLDGLSAMLLPKLVPGIHIGPNVRIADDDERTLVDEYEAHR
jgi:hypothetical protein